MSDECPHCTPGDISFTMHYDPDPFDCTALLPGTKVNMSILGVDGKERDCFNAHVDEVDGIPRLTFPYDPLLQDGETVQVNPLSPLDTPRTRDTD